MYEDSVYEDSADDDEITIRKPTIARSRKVNFEGFKNRFSEDEDVYALDVLVASDGDLMDDIRQEMSIRQVKARGDKRRGGRVQIPKASILPKEDGRIQRVRIQSESIVYHLFRAMDQPWSQSWPVVFSRPFIALIHIHNKMEQALADLESKWADEERHQLNKKAALNAQKEKADDGDLYGSDDDKEPADVIVGVEALRDMRCYVQFINNEIIPLSKKFDGTSRKRVCFDELGLLFNVGDLVWASDALSSTASNARIAGMYQPLWKIFALTLSTAPFEYSERASVLRRRRTNEADDDGDVGEEDEDTILEYFKIQAYYIDHDGTSYGAVMHEFVVPRYSGKQEITELPCYPIRFAENYEAKLEALTAQGEKFKLCLESSYLTYDGWTLISKPNGEPMKGKAGSSGMQRRLQLEYIDSNVIVDLVETFHDMPEWKPTFYKHKTVMDRWMSTRDAFPTLIWINQSGWLEDKFLQASSKQSQGFNVQTIPVIGTEHYALLPRRLFAYALKNRRIVCVDINNLEFTSANSNAFDTLAINEGYKRMVRSLVSSHLAKRKLEKSYIGTSRVKSQTQDIIQGKGRSLMILLHGVPGVGKTATAEAIAMENHKPLFDITSGDLGLTPKEVEESLTEIFRLAHMWDCVLIFDEADAFLAQRSQLDLQRNALVSVFLRTLEYYNGILFLTTNRLATLDDAFKSRIHLSLYYMPLDDEQMSSIFRMNIRKLKEIEKERARMTNEDEIHILEHRILEFAAQHHEKSATSSRWNGRQIRNAFQIAVSLARYNNDGSANLRPILDDSHFREAEDQFRSNF
ncbi:hypothetical protein ONZ43_g6580 [Nemania bipapillata]|uniref:Uncharacterized protein n=1 Tax=Nemania bipapillata TaxID=110536 RepID=A0ACC2HXW6_9PEZI|nr:hypothetical protein ONZ43_g6580 [Nemania bipapillata]